MEGFISNVISNMLPIALICVVALIFIYAASGIIIHYVRKSNTKDEDNESINVIKMVRGIACAATLFVGVLAGVVFAVFLSNPFGSNKEVMPRAISDESFSSPAKAEIKVSNKIAVSEKAVELKKDATANNNAAMSEIDKLVNDSAVKAE